MKNVFKQIGFAALVAIMALIFAAPVYSGGIADRVFSGGAKNLAKQTLDLTKKAADIEKKAAELQVKAAEIEEKTAALSARDRGIFREEMARLNVEGPEWLFSNAPGLLAYEAGGTDDDTGNATPTTVGEGSGILGRLAGIIQGIGGRGGNRNSGAASGGILGGRTGVFFSMFDGKNYHMKAKSTVEGMEVVVETYTKGDMTASVSETMGMTTRVIYRDNMAYIVNDAQRTVMVYPYTASTAPEEPVRTTGLVMTGSGTARFDGRNLYYEEYSLSTEEGGVKTQWFLNGNNLAGLRTITSQMTIDMVILTLDQNVPNNVFEIPAAYQRIEMPRMPGGN